VDDDEAVWRRVKMIEFTHKLEEGQIDKELGIKLATPEARAALLAWLVKGCLQWVADGKLGEPPEACQGGQAGIPT
jgi:phage/plasmid-associated DNA primase